MPDSSVSQNAMSSEPTEVRESAASNVEQDRSVVYAFTATPKAIERFRQALMYAESTVYERAEAMDVREGTSDRVEKAREHGEWLRWGLSRIAYGREESR